MHMAVGRVICVLDTDPGNLSLQTVFQVLHDLFCYYPEV